MKKTIFLIVCTLAIYGISFASAPKATGTTAKSASPASMLAARNSGANASTAIALATTAATGDENCWYGFGEETVPVRFRTRHGGGKGTQSSDIRDSKKGEAKNPADKSSHIIDIH